MSANHKPAVISMRKTLLIIISAAVVLCAAAGIYLALSGRNAERDEIRAKDPANDGWTVITLDPGHGGKSPGGVGVYGGEEYVERDLVMRLALYLKDELEKYDHVKAYLTREDNSENPGLWERVKMGKENGSDVVISLHLNGGNGERRGASVLVTHGKYDPKELKPIEDGLALSILAEIETQIGVRSNGLYLADSKKVTYPNGEPADYYGIVRSGINLGIPAILVEHCYLDNDEDFELALSTDEKLMALAKADADGIAKYYELKPKTDE